MIRRMAVAGMFYPGDAKSLELQLDRCFAEAASPACSAMPLALVCPHAGYPYSGAVAASAYKSIPPGSGADVVVVLGPNHTGMGDPLSVSDADAWETVGGTLPLERSLAADLVQMMPACSLDRLAHLSEHALEVQIPFLTRTFPQGFALVPIAIGLPPSMRAHALCEELGSALALLLENRRFLIVASTDMSHYISADEARVQDAYAFDAIGRMDSAGLVEAVSRHNITMCGVMPTAAMIQAAKRLGAQEATLVDYRNSGDATGDRDQVVSYAAFAVTGKL